MNRWYQKGLIDVDYMTGNSIYADSKMIASGTSGAWFGIYTMPSDLSAKDQNIKVIAVSPPKLNEHDTLHIQKNTASVIICFTSLPNANILKLF